MSSPVRFTFDDTALEVTADDAPLAWLEFFLRPWFAPAGSQAAGTVRLVVDPDRHEAILRTAGGSATAGQDVPCFVLDSGLVSLPSLGSLDGRHWILDEAFSAVYGVEAGAVEIVVRADGPGARVALMRVVRELTMVDQRRRGNVVLHSSAVAHDGRSIAFCGPKRAGKSSMLLHSLAAPGAEFVANDRAVASLGDDGRLVLRGLPTIVSLRADTLSRFPDVARHVRAAPDRHWLTADESSRRTARPWADTERAVDLAPASLCRLLDVEPRADAPLGALVLPMIDPTAAGLELVAASPTSALTQLRAGLVGAALGDVPVSALAGDQHPPTEAEREAQEMTLVALSRLPVYSARVGSAAFVSEWPGQRLLRRAA